MADNQWNDDKLEKLLHSMPKQLDERPPSEILERLKKDERLNKKKRPKTNRWIPSIVTVAALLLLSILIPSMMSNKSNNEIGLEAQLENNAPAAKRSMDVQTESEESEENEESDVSNADDGAVEPATFAMSAMMKSHVVLPGETDNRVSFPIGLIHDANVIPVTFLIPEEKITLENPDSVALYNEYAGKLDEAEYGFDEYHPYKGSLSVSGNTVVHQLPENHQYDRSSATIQAYVGSIRETFKDYADFKAVNAADDPVIFDSIGEKVDDSMKRRMPYFKYVMPNGGVYLIPYENGDDATAVQALLAMKQAENDLVEEVVPSDVDYNVEETEGKLVLTFTEPLDLNAMRQETAIEMIEGFMLTAESYGLQIQLENVTQEHYSKYDLTKPLPKPIGANPILLP